LSLFRYLHECKVASTNQINRDVFVASIVKTRERLQKLRAHGLICAVARDEEVDQCMVYSLTKVSARMLKQIYPEMFLIDRLKSNSINHDLRLNDVKYALTSKTLVTNYWTENILQSSIAVTNNLELSVFRTLQVDALVKLDNKQGGELLCALELEASCKGAAKYERKLKILYSAAQVGVVLYVCMNPEIEQVLKKNELLVSPAGQKKIYYAQYGEVTSKSMPVVFQNQNGFVIEII